MAALLKEAGEGISPNNAETLRIYTGLAGLEELSVDGINRKWRGVVFDEVPAVALVLLHRWYTVEEKVKLLHEYWGSLDDIHVGGRNNGRSLSSGSHMMLLPSRLFSPNPAKLKSCQHELSNNCM